VVVLAYSCGISIALGLKWEDMIFPVFELGLGEGEFFSGIYEKYVDDEVDDYKRYYTQFLFTSYVVVVKLLVLNLLIAVMSETAINMLGKTFKYRQRIIEASTIMFIERRLMTWRYYIDSFLWLFSCKKYNTHTECPCCHEHEHPWTGWMVQRTGKPGRHLCKSIKFDKELAVELSRNYTFNVLDTVAAWVENDDVEESNFEEVAEKFEKEVHKCNDLLKVENRLWVMQQQLHHRILNSEADESKLPIDRKLVTSKEQSGRGRKQEIVYCY